MRVQNITAIAEAVVPAAPRIISELCNTLSALVGHNAHTPVALSLNLRRQHAGTETRDLRALLKIGSESRRSIRKFRHTAIVVIGGCQAGNTATQKNRRGNNLPMRKNPGEKAKREAYAAEDEVCASAEAGVWLLAPVALRSEEALEVLSAIPID